MKFTGLVTLAAATLAAAESQVSWGERHAWQSCTDKLLNEYSQGITGDAPSCNLWDCLHEQADNYHRGGGITEVAKILTPVCTANKFNPGNWFGGNPGGNRVPVSNDEVRDWSSCTDNLLKEFDMGSAGNKAACNMWVCLHNQASKYHRGGILTKASNLLSPICIPAGIFLPN